MIGRLARHSALAATAACVAACSPSSQTELPGKPISWKLPGFVRLVNLTSRPQSLSVNGKAFAHGVGAGQASAFSVIKSGSVDLSTDSGYRSRRSLAEKEPLSLYLVEKGGHPVGYLVSGEPNHVSLDESKAIALYLSDKGQAATATANSSAMTLKPGVVTPMSLPRYDSVTWTVTAGGKSASASGKLDKGQSGSFVASDVDGKLRAFFFVDSDQKATKAGAAGGS